MVEALQGSIMVSYFIDCNLTLAYRGLYLRGSPHICPIAPSVFQLWVRLLKDFILEHGVPQGSCFGPVLKLFSILTAHLPNVHT